MGFHAVLIEGLFYYQDGSLLADLNGKVSLVEELLEPCLGSRVKCVVQFLPPHPPQFDRWGAGCCMWEPSGHCPAGHHKDPGRMLNFHRDGVFSREESLWRVDEWEVPIKLLDGHRGRVVVITDLGSVDLTNADADKLDEMMGDVLRVRGILDRLQGLTRET